MPLFSKKLFSRSKHPTRSQIQDEKSKRDDRRRRLRSSLSLEILERREVYDAGGGELFVKALNDVDQKVVAAEVVVDSIGGAIGSIPLIGDKVAPYVTELHNAIDDVHKVVQQLANTVNSQALQNILRQKAYDVLGPSGAGILLNFGGTGPADSPDDAQITLDLANQSIDVHFHLGKSWKAVTGNADLSISMVFGSATSTTSPTCVMGSWTGTGMTSL